MGAYAVQFGALGEGLHAAVDGAGVQSDHEIGRGRVGHVPKRGDGGGKPIDEQAEIFALSVLVRLAATDAYAELTGFGGRLDILPPEIGHFGSAHSRAKQQGDYRGVDLAACVCGSGGLDATS